MDRGPMALFASIVAVGLGPALWLGVQFGTVDITPTQPPTVSEQRTGGQELLGGAGAGSPATADGDTVIRATPKSNVRPVTRPASPSRSASSSPTKPAPSPTMSKPAEPTGEPSPTRTESTTGPTEPSGSDPDPGEQPVPPEPPAESAAATPSAAGQESGVGAGEEQAAG